MTSSERHLVATLTAWAALGLAAFVAAFSEPIDDFWLSLASARAIAGGADSLHAIGLHWIPAQPGALNPQWGAQLVLGAVNTTWWPLAVNAALIIIGLVVTALRVRRRSSMTATAVAMLLMITALAPLLVARAQSFSIALVPVALLLLDRRPAPRWLPVAFAILVAVWANLHGAFVIGQVAVLAALGGELVRWRSSGETAGAGLMSLTAAAALVGPLLNPVGVSLLAYVYAQPALAVVRSISVEWQPAWPSNPIAAIFWCYLGLLVVGRLARRGGVGLGEGLLALTLGLLAAYSFRQIPWFLLATAPLLASDIDALLGARPWLARSVGSVAGPLGGRRAGIWLALAAALVIAIQPARMMLPSSIARLNLNEPGAAADLLEQVIPAGSHQRILNELGWGGYLSYRLGERVETAMDGRLEIHDRSTWDWYFGLLGGDGDPAADLASRSVRWAVVSPGRGRLVSKLLGAGWRIRLESGEAVLLQRS